MSPRDRRAVLVGLFVVSVVWVALRGVPSLVRLVQTEEARIQQEVLLLERARWRMTRLAELDDSIRALEVAARALPSVLLVGQDAETASVDLMRRARELVAPWPVRLLGFEAIRPRPEDSELVLAELGLQLETDLNTLLGVVRSIEADTAVGVERLEIESRNAHSSSSAPERIIARIGVSGWFRPDLPKAEEPMEFVR